jgi:hypothetical protein
VERLLRYCIMSIYILALLLSGCGPTQNALTPPPPILASPTPSPSLSPGQATPLPGKPLPPISAHNAQIALEEAVLLRAVVARVGQIARADTLDCSDVALLQSLVGVELALPFDRANGEQDDGSDLASWQVECERARSGVAQSVERLAVGCAGGDLKPDWYGMAAGEIPRLNYLREAALTSLGVQPQATSVLPLSAARVYAIRPGSWQGKLAALPFAELPANSRMELFYAADTEDGRWCLVRPLDSQELMGWVECKSLAHLRYTHKQAILYTPQ